MPLRSVEAATRDDAIAAAREQFGPQARVVGVRRVRSGGVLGFFATERYVAEVAPELSGRPGVPVPAAARTSPAREETSPEAFSSPLASAAPARARATAPARNGAAAWAAEAARSGESARPATRSTAPAAAAWSSPADDERVSELAGLLAAASAAAPTPAAEPQPAYSRAAFPRASFPRAGRSLLDDDDEDPLLVDDGPVVPASAAPSPFTAALARMVAGDRDVRQAVQEALEPAAAPTGVVAGPWPFGAGRIGSADTSVARRAPQEEETVGDQVIAPSSMTAAQPVEIPTQMPTWAEPEGAAPTDSSREEAIAEVLRSALAQGHSDEALAGILRKVLDDASPQTALSAPQVPQVAAPETTAEDVAAPSTVSPLAAFLSARAPEPQAAPVVPALVDVAPVVEAAPLPEPSPVAAPAAPVAAAAPEPAVTPASVEPIWAVTPEQSPLWAETVSQLSAPVVATDAPIWAEVVLQEPSAQPAVHSEPVAVEPVAVEPVAVEPLVVEPPVAEPVAAAEAAAEAVAVAPAVEEPVVAEEESAVEMVAAEETAAAELAEIAEVAPILARTASDPAPMSLDATTVMPPISLLPPLPGSRPRGLPPVPPKSSRPAVPPSRTSAAASTAAPTSTPSEAAAPAPEASGTPSLATVTRLPVAPLMASPDIPEMPELDEEPVVEGPSAVPSAATPSEAAASRSGGSRAVPGDVIARLETLGLPGDLLGSGFADDVAVHGTYAALTRALGLRLPPAPELPTGAGEVLFVVGPGVETLRAARSLAVSLRLDPDRVQWATRGDLASLAPAASRMTTIDAAIDRRHDATESGTVTIVAVDAPLRTDAYWMAQMLAIWTPVAVWAVVEATRKPEDLQPWIDGLTRVDALIVQDTDLSADPAAVLRRVAAPVALLDGVRATPHRWASLLCERLESAQA